jgi:nitrate/nitrite transporter NarK
MASIPNFVGWFGAIFGGWWTDRLTVRFGRRLGRAFPMSVSRFVAMTAFLLLILEPSAWVATALFAMVAFGTDLGSPSVWAYNQDVGGRYIASVLGWGNMWGNLGAAASPSLLDEVVRSSGGWNAAWMICAAAFLIAGVCAACVNADKPIDRHGLE